MNNEEITKKLEDLMGNLKDLYFKTLDLHEKSIIMMCNTEDTLEILSILTKEINDNMNFIFEYENLKKEFSEVKIELYYKKDWKGILEMDLCLSYIYNQIKIIQEYLTGINLFKSRMEKEFNPQLN